MNEHNDTNEVIGGVFALIGIVIVIWSVVLGIRWAKNYAHSFPTTYCTSWTRAVSITPTNHDNGKYSDEQYVVKYEDGSIDGQDQGSIPYARCTNKVQTTGVPKDDWKKVDSLGYVDWEQ